MPHVQARLHSLSHDQSNLTFPQSNEVLTNADAAPIKRRIIGSFLLVALALGASAFLCTSSSAQVRFGGVVGTVADPSDAAISGANVKLTNLGTNEVRTIQTSNGGIFSFPNLIAGVYRVEVEMSGFKHFVQDRVEVQVDVSTR